MYPLRITVLLTAAATAQAETAPLPAPFLLASHRPDTVVVTASRADTPLARTPAAIAQLDREAIGEKRPAFLGEVLNSVAGVHMTDLGNEQHNMSIRQPLSYSAVYLYMEDGIPIRPLGLFNHNSLYEVNLDGAGKVEVIKGPASSLYGSNSVGGTINFLTEAPSREPTLRFGAHGSDQGYWRAHIDASASEGAWGGRVAGYVSRRNGGWQDFNDAEKESLTARGDWQGEVTHLKTVLTYNHLCTDMPGSLFADDYRERPGFSYNRFTYREVFASRASVMAEGDWFGLGDTSVTVYARSNSTEQLPSYLIFNSGAGSASGRRNDNDFVSLGLDARQQMQFDWLDGRLVAGVSAENTDNDFIEQNLAITRLGDGSYADYRLTTLRRRYDVELGNRAAYAQYEISPLADTRLVLGARYDAIEYDYRNRLVPGAGTGAPSERRDFEHWSPKIAFIWSPHPHHSIYINRADGFTPPEVSALYSTSVAADLEESVYHNTEVGWRASLFNHKVDVDASLYRLEGRDEVVSYSIAPGLSESRNAGETVHQGIELGIHWTISREWQLDIAATRSRHEFRDYQASAALDYSGNDIPAAPIWLANTELHWTPQFLPAFKAALEWSHVGKYWMNNANTVRYGGYDLFNLRLQYAISRWTLWLKGTNLGDRHYADIAASTYSGVGAYTANTMDTYAPGAPRTVSLGFDYRSDD